MEIWRSRTICSHLRSRRCSSGEGPSTTDAASPAGGRRSCLAHVGAGPDVMGVVSLAFEPGAAFWDSAFALADRVDRADPSRAGVAPLRTRFNLLAAAAGAARS